MILSGLSFHLRRNQSISLHNDSQPRKMHPESDPIHAYITMQTHLITPRVGQYSNEYGSRPAKMSYADGILRRVWTLPNTRGSVSMCGSDKFGNRLTVKIHVFVFEANGGFEYGSPTDHLKTAFYEAFSRSPNEIPAAQVITVNDSKGQLLKMVWGTHFECRATVCWLTDDAKHSTLLLDVGPTFEVTERSN